MLTLGFLVNKVQLLCDLAPVHCFPSGEPLHVQPKGHKCDLSRKNVPKVSRFKTDSRSPAVHLPFERTGMPFECLELSVLKNSSSVRTVWAIRSRKLISRSNGSSYPFKKNHQPFERLELSVQEIHQPFEWLKLSVREIHQPFEWLTLSVREICSCSNKTRLQNNSPFFVQ